MLGQVSVTIGSSANRRRATATAPSLPNPPVVLPTAAITGAASATGTGAGSATHDQAAQREYQTKLRAVVFLCFKKIDEIHAGTSDRLISFSRYNETKFKNDMGRRALLHWEL